MAEQERVAITNLLATEVGHLVDVSVADAH